MLQPPAAALELPLLLLLLVVQAPLLTGARPSTGPDYLRRGWLRLLAEGEGCAPCRPEECAAPQGCLAGRVRDACGCCWECANLEGQLCDLDPSAHFYGRCGEQLECRLDAGGDLSRGEVPEPLCACLSQRPLCGSDRRTYAQICRLQEAARAQPDANLTVAHPGPCESGTHGPGPYSQYLGFLEALLHDPQWHWSFASRTKKMRPRVQYKSPFSLLVHRGRCPKVRGTELCVKAPDLTGRDNPLRMGTHSQLLASESEKVKTPRFCPDRWSPGKRLGFL